MKIVYWSGSGNTEKMADLIAKGVNEGGKNAEIINVSDANSNIFDNEEIIVLGCPAMGSEVLEECEFEPFIDSISDKVSGKKVALFGSYDWGDGQWMRDWKDRMEGLGCQLINDGLIIQEASSEDCEECIDLGKMLSSI
ncbi:flavodoxin [Romboutsia weinsteinii]|uniref:Flavodoxin n=1 Tax=Romboutsia weinsteinii TaxID=2020949 RepID=A0A371J2W0_9FIRM|nr:flavodoxin [Romboutsia weinsteinii]RDY27024.1 flavodoxin [Romboutsia weinsteinii]